MRHEMDSRKVFTRRALILSGGKLAFLSLLAARLYYLQVVQGSTYQMQSDSNRIKLQLLPPPRGKILDRFGNLLAGNKPNYRALYDGEKNEKTWETLDHFASLLKLSPDETEAMIREFKENYRSNSPTLLREYLSWQEVSRIEVNAIDLPGIFIDQGQVRSYIYNEMLAHTIGYVGAVNEEQFRENPLYRIPDFKVGKMGIEKLHEEQLRGTAGVRRLEVDAFGRTVGELARQESVAGEDIRLTIDIRLQQFTAQRIAEESAAVVVMDVHHGDILAITSMPAYDPNRFSQGIKTKYWKSLLNNKKTPLLPKTIAGQYPPGSTFKMIVCLAALEAGMMRPEDTVYCPGHMDLGSHRFHCWKTWGHGYVNMRSAIAESCDVYFYQVAHKLGWEKIAEMARRFGLGEPTGIEIPGEKGGLIPDGDWKRGVHAQPWLPGDTLNASIGQGYMLATPLQLAVMTARLASGKRVSPHLIYHPEPETPEPMDIDPAHLKVVREGMQWVTTRAGGTAYWSRIPKQEYAMAGKTGTSQVKRINRQIEVKQEDLPWEERHHALFVGYAPIYKPRYAAALIVEHGGSGSAAAAPIVRDILLETQKLDPTGKALLPLKDGKES